jgi:hypothetical protein
MPEIGIEIPIAEFYEDTDIEEPDDAADESARTAS